MAGELKRMPSCPCKVSGALICHLNPSRRKKHATDWLDVFLIPSVVLFCMVVITGLCFARLCLNRRVIFMVSNAGNKQYFHHGICSAKVIANDSLKIGETT